MAVKVVNFLKKYYEDIEVLWRCTIPEGKSQYKYNTVLEWCRQSQYYLAVLLILPLIFWQNFWKLIHGATLRDGFALITIEVMGWIVLGYVLGLKRLPANYISLAIIKAFVVLDKTFKPKVHDFQVKVLEESRQTGQWSVITYNPGKESLSLHSQFRNVCLIAVGFVCVWVIGKCTKIDVSRQENCALISITAVTSTAAILLMTTLSFDTFPNGVEFHRRCCELWIMLFMLQRVQRVLRGEMKPSQIFRLWWESSIFILSLHIMFMYIPAIHEEFSTRDVLEHKTEILTDAIVPTDISNIYKSSSVFRQKFVLSITKMCSRLLRQGTTYAEQDSVSSSKTSDSCLFCWAK